ncbi:MAG: glycosyltransferase [Deltaproteobacteria bacterium]|nr:MAG: glycosyltransferase [Deltaproteobacteria bacterium]
MSEICVISTIFPANAPYFEDFFRAYATQTRRDFDLILFDDGGSGMDIAAWRSRFRKIEVIPVPPGKTPAEVRAFLTGWVAASDYTYVVFADSDDTCTPNRVEDAVAQLEKAAFVFHDMNLIDADHGLLAPAYWRARLRPGEAIARPFLERKNVLGFGNTSVRKSALFPVDIPAGLRAADWFYFSVVLGDRKARFTTKSLVNYRQHAHNLSGLGPMTPARLHDLCEVKEVHYRHLAKREPAFLPLLEENAAFQERLRHDAGFTAHYVATWNARKIHDFWWETEFPEGTP